MKGKPSPNGEGFTRVTCKGTREGILQGMTAVVHLQALGLTEYEARAYTALLALGRAVPARIARQAGIPRPKIYETLQRLEARGLAARVGENPMEYAPLSAREYIERARRAFDGRLDALERDLSRLTPDPAPEAVYALRGDAAVRSLCETLALGARSSLYLAGDETFALHLERVTGRGVEVVRTEIKDLPPIAAQGQGAFLLARDGEAAVVAHFVEEGGREVHGVHTHNPVIVRLVEGYVMLAARSRQGE